METIVGLITLAILMGLMIAPVYLRYLGRQFAKGIFEYIRENSNIEIQNLQIKKGEKHGKSA